MLVLDSSMLLFSVSVVKIPFVHQTHISKSFTLCHVNYLISQRHVFVFPVMSLGFFCGNLTKLILHLGVIYIYLLFPAS